VFINGEMYVADSSHANFKAIVTAVVTEDEGVVELFDVEKAVAKRFERVSDRVSVANGQVYFDGDLVDTRLTQQIVRFMNDEVEDWKPLVNFYENIASNPNNHSRQQLFEWLERRNFTITPDGCILAYKAVHADGEGFKSASSGTAQVNGETQTGQIKQKVGDVVEMPRSAVQHDPSVGCHTGLHVGTWEYARSFLGNAGTVVLCKVNPRDIVSVPTDCDAAKVRTCRYVIVEVSEGALESAVHGQSDVCSECGGPTCCFDDVCDECYNYGTECVCCGTDIASDEEYCDECYDAGCA
jgi:hypothetical protein